MSNKKFYADSIKSLRNDLGFTQSEMASMISCPIKTYQRWEQEGCKAYIYNLLFRSYLSLRGETHICDAASLPVPLPEQVHIACFDDNHEELDYPWDTDFWCLRE